MKRSSILAAVVAAAGLWLGPAAPAPAAPGRSATTVSRVAFQPVVDPAGCRAAVLAMPRFASLAAMQAFTTTGPCATAPQTSTSAALAPHTIACPITITHLEETLGLLNDWVTDTFSILSCSGASGSVTRFCENLTIIADAVPAVEPGIPALGSGCDSRSPIQETPAALHVPAVQAGIVVAFDSAGDVGVHPATGTFPT